MITPLTQAFAKCKSLESRGASPKPAMGACCSCCCRKSKEEDTFHVERDFMGSGVLRMLRMVRFHPRQEMLRVMEIVGPAFAHEDSF